MVKFRSIDGLRTHRERLVRAVDPSTPLVILSSGTCGRANKSEEVADVFATELPKQTGNGAPLRVTGCLGFCEREPIVIV
jgi:hypothetical protein